MPVTDLIVPNRGSPASWGTIASRDQIAHAMGVTAQSLTAQQKYTNSYRINFPNFAEACRISYAKGVIDDGADGSECFYWIDQTSQDPPQVVMSSLVKVKGSWGVSDYIELFYHPRPQYWDTNGTPATECINGYFTHAFMSFRYGDEVKVLLQDGVPQVVIGFYDRTPRIGENIVKVSGDFGDYLFSSWQLNQNLISLEGPDGLDLGLTLKADMLFEHTITQLLKYYSDVKQRGYKLLVGPIMSLLVITNSLDYDGKYFRNIGGYDSVGNYYPDLWHSIVDYDSALAAVNNRKLFLKTTYQVYPSSPLFNQEYMDSDWHWPDIYTRPHN